MNKSFLVLFFKKEPLACAALAKSCRTDLAFIDVVSWTKSYTPSSSNVPLTEVPEPLAKKLPRCPTVPAVLIGWLGRHSGYAGQGLGAALLFDAIKTVATAPIGAHAIFADAIDDQAAAFYGAFGFTPSVRQPRTLYLPVATALSLLSP